MIAAGVAADEGGGGEGADAVGEEVFVVDEGVEMALGLEGEEGHEERVAAEQERERAGERLGWGNEKRAGQRVCFGQCDIAPISDRGFPWVDLVVWG